SVYNLGKPIDFASVDDSTARWVQEFSIKPYANPAKLESSPCVLWDGGLAALCCATEEQKWIFSGYSMTGASVFELLRSAEFANLPLIVEDFVKDSGGSYTGGLHVMELQLFLTGNLTKLCYRLFIKTLKNHINLWKMCIL
uniref:Uncharacterized protein n=1 Tax=Sinocyclocheilus grahami TaxID=75366 RepID=A0A672RYL6_SINGR